MLSSMLLIYNIPIVSLRYKCPQYITHYTHSRRMRRNLERPDRSHQGSYLSVLGRQGRRIIWCLQGSIYAEFSETPQLFQFLMIVMAYDRLSDCPTLFWDIHSVNRTHEIQYVDKSDIFIPMEGRALVLIKSCRIHTYNSTLAWWFLKNMKNFHCTAVLGKRRKVSKVYLF